MFYSLHFRRKSLISEILNVFYEHKSEIGAGAQVIFFPSFDPRKKRVFMRLLMTISALCGCEYGIVRLC